MNNSFRKSFIFSIQKIVDVDFVTGSDGFAESVHLRLMLHVDLTDRYSLFLGQFVPRGSIREFCPPQRCLVLLSVPVVRISHDLFRAFL